MSTPPPEPDPDEAVRDILFMYRDLIVSYRGFGHGIDQAIGRFDPAAFLTSDSALLRAGAAIALLCDLSDAWDEFGEPMESSPRLSIAFESLRSGTFADMPEIESAFALGFGRDEQAFRSQLAIVYERYVVGYFRDLIAGN